MLTTTPVLAPATKLEKELKTGDTVSAENNEQNGSDFPSARATDDLPVVAEAARPKSAHFFISGATAKHCFVGERLTFKIVSKKLPNSEGVDVFAGRRSSAVPVDFDITVTRAKSDDEASGTSLQIIARGKIDLNQLSASKLDFSSHSKTDQRAGSFRAGVYTAHICVKCLGHFDVNVKYADRHIRGSPFCLKVSSHAPRFSTSISVPNGNARRNSDRYSSSMVANAASGPKKSHTFHDGFLTTDAHADEHNAAHHDKSDRLTRHVRSRHASLQPTSHHAHRRSDSVGSSSDAGSVPQPALIVRAQSKAENCSVRNRTQTSTLTKKLSTTPYIGPVLRHGVRFQHQPSQQQTFNNHVIQLISLANHWRNGDKTRSTSRAQSDSISNTLNRRQDTPNSIDNLNNECDEDECASNCSAQPLSQQLPQPAIQFGRYGRFLGCFLNPQDVCFLPARHTAQPTAKDYDSEEDEQNEEAAEVQENNFRFFRSGDSGLLSVSNASASPSAASSSAASSTLGDAHTPVLARTFPPTNRSNLRPKNITDLLITDSNLPAIQRFALSYNSNQTVQDGIDNNFEENSAFPAAIHVQCKISERGRQPQQILRPTGVCYIPSSREFIIADYEKAALLGFDGATHRFLFQAGRKQLLGPKGLAYCQQTRRLFVADNRANRVCIFFKQKVALDSLQTRRIGKKPMETVQRWEKIDHIGTARSNWIGQTAVTDDFLNPAVSQPLFAGPHFVAVDEMSADVYVSDFHHHTVQTFTSEGRLKSIFDTQALLATRRMNNNYTYDNTTELAQPPRSDLCAPTGIALDPDNNLLLIASWANGSVDAYDMRTTQFVRSVVPPCTLFGPQGIDIDLAERMVVVCDAGNHRIVGYHYLMQ